MKFYEIKPSAVERGFLELDGEPLALCAGDAAESAAQAGFGTLGDAPAVFLVLSPDRPVCKQIEAGGLFSVCAFEKGVFRDSLTALSPTRPSRTLESVGFTPTEIDGAPCCEEAETIFLCEKIGAQPFGETDRLITARIRRIMRKKPGFRDRLVGCC